MASEKKNIIWGLLNALHPSMPTADISLIGVKASCLLLNTLAEVTITQRYKNTSSKPIQIMYVFPVDDEAAVSGFNAHLGQRRVRGVIKEKKQAGQEYKAALDEGHGAALLETAGTGALCVRLGNLAADSEAEISLVYSTLCPVEEDSIVLKIPTTIKERYMPIKALQGSDAESQQPSYSSSVSYGLGLDVDIFMCGPIINVSSSTHPLSVSNDPDDSSHCQATLGVEKVAMDSDVLVRVSHSEVRKPVVFLSSQAEVDGGSASLMLSFAPQFGESQMCGGKGLEFVFLVDRSGSMGSNGTLQSRPIDLCRDALQLFLRSLPEGCLFNIVGFGSKFTKLFSTSRVYDASNLDEASRHVAAINNDMGGTEILEPLKSILSESMPGYANVCEGDTKRNRKLFLLTDGAVGNTAEVIQTVKENAGSTQVFTFGVGDGAASDLVNGVARAGRGEACFVRHGEPIDEKVITQLGKAMEPVLEDVSIDWGVLQVEEQSPAKDDLAPVFNNTPYTVLALLSKDSQHQGQVVLSGKLNGKEQQFEVNVTPWTTTRTDCRILHSLAAKHIIRDLQEKMNRPGSSNQETKILALSLRFDVASSQASFVAIEEHEETQANRVLSSVRIPLTWPDWRRKWCDISPDWRPCGSVIAGYDRSTSKGRPDQRMERCRGRKLRDISQDWRPCGSVIAGYDRSMSKGSPDRRKERRGISPDWELDGSMGADSPDRRRKRHDISPDWELDGSMGADSPDRRRKRHDISPDWELDGSMGADSPDRRRKRHDISPDWELDGSMGADSPDRTRKRHDISPDWEFAVSSTSLGSVSGDPLQLLILLQDANGSWILDDSLAKAVQLPKELIASAQPADTNGGMSAASVWATAVALAFLLKKCAEKRAVFSLLEKKARKWMAEQDGVSADKASDLISSAEHLF